MQGNYAISSCSGNITVTNETAGVVLHNATITSETVSVLNLNTTVLEFFKNDTETVTLESSAFGINV